jgi:hypothetical protein
VGAVPVGAVPVGAVPVGAVLVDGVAVDGVLVDGVPREAAWPGAVAAGIASARETPVWASRRRAVTGTSRAAWGTASNWTSPARAASAAPGPGVFPGPVESSPADSFPLDPFPLDPFSLDPVPGALPVAGAGAGEAAPSPPTVPRAAVEPPVAVEVPDVGVIKRSPGGIAATVCAMTATTKRPPVGTQEAGRAAR